MSQKEHLPPKFLVLVDEALETKAALRWVERRIQVLGGGIVLLIPTKMDDYPQWLGSMSALMKEEAKEQASAILAYLVAEVETVAGIKPETHIFEGDKLEGIQNILKQDKTISNLVLPISSKKELANLVAKIISQKEGFRIPVTLVPGDLTYNEIDALT